jgi:hypothetical protein
MVGSVKAILSRKNQRAWSVSEYFPQKNALPETYLPT